MMNKIIFQPVYYGKVNKSSRVNSPVFKAKRQFSFIAIE